ncbi:hypothetical protein ACFLYH_02855 [Candidatus Dependentiae bacterium]
MIFKKLILITLLALNLCNSNSQTMEKDNYLITTKTISIEEKIKDDLPHLNKSQQLKLIKFINISAEHFKKVINKENIKKYKNVKYDKTMPFTDNWSHEAWLSLDKNKRQYFCDFVKNKNKSLLNKELKNRLIRMYKEDCLRSICEKFKNLKNDDSIEAEINKISSTISYHSKLIFKKDHFIPTLAKLLYDLKPIPLEEL